MSKAPYIIYGIFIVLVASWLGTILAAPLLAMQKNDLANSFYSLHKPFCHQMVKRSFCFFNDGTNTWVGDCVSNNETVIGALNPATGRPHTTLDNNIVGYSFAEDARDTSFYLALLIGGLIFPLIRRINDNKVPSILWLIIALVPIGLDGTTQLIGLRESTNYLRFITGFIAGFVVPFYLIPILNNLLSDKKEVKNDKKE